MYNENVKSFVILFSCCNLNQFTNCVHISGACILQMRMMRIIIITIQIRHEEKTKERKKEVESVRACGSMAEMKIVVIQWKMCILSDTQLTFLSISIKCFISNWFISLFISIRLGSFFCESSFVLVWEVYSYFLRHNLKIFLFSLSFSLSLSDWNVQIYLVKRDGARIIHIMISFAL